jgi:hypothetical protein
MPIATGLLAMLSLTLAGCGDTTKPSVFSNKDDHDHSHERDKMMLEDVKLEGKTYHAALTAHLSKADGNELDIFLETLEKEPKPAPVTQGKLTAKVTLADGSEKNLQFEPAPKSERKDDAEGKCSHYVAKAPWLKAEDVLTLTLSIDIGGEVKKVIWEGFNPKKYAHHED